MLEAKILIVEKQMKISIVVATYNEYSRVGQVLREIRGVTDSEIIVVDDGSNKKSRVLLDEVLRSVKNCRLLRHERNLGKGAAMRTGAKSAWQRQSDAVVFIDADGQHDPKFLPEFIDRLAKYDLVFGYRELNHTAPAYRRLGNYLVKKLCKYLFHIDRKDLLCGFFAISRSVYDQILWTSDRYGVETEIATKVGKKQLDFAEVKINTTYIHKYKGVTILDAMKIFLKIPGWYWG